MRTFRPILRTIRRTLNYLKRGRPRWRWIVALALIAAYLAYVGNEEPHYFAYGIAATILLLHGVARVTKRHPLFNPEYYAWLITTPWSGMQPPPLGHVRLELRDAQFLAFTAYAASWISLDTACWALCMYLAGYLAAAVLASLHLERRMFSYVIASSGALALACGLYPEAALAVLVLTLPIAFQAFRSMWEDFPWTPEMRAHADEGEDDSAPGTLAVSLQKRDERLMIAQAVGGPWAALSAVDAPMPFSGLAFIAIGSLAMWWQLAIEVLSFQLGDAFYVGWFPMVDTGAALLCAATVIRAASYSQRGYAPISLLGRLLTFRFIVPRYDYMYLSPLVALALASTAWIVDLPALRVWAVGLATAVVVLGPPSMAMWVLTGCNRLR